MVVPIPSYLLPQRLEHVQQFADASRLRAALYPSPEPPPVRRRPLTAVLWRPADPVAHRAGPPPGMSGHGELHRAPGARPAGRMGVESTRRVETTVVRIAWPRSGRTIRWGSAGHPVPT